MNVSKLIKEQKKLKKLISDFSKKDYSPVVGQQVRITSKYAKWLKANMDQIHTKPGQTSPEETTGFFLDKQMARKRIVGKITKIEKQELFELTATVVFKFKNQKIKVLLDLSDLESA
jgi:hypothetical protein